VITSSEFGEDGKSLREQHISHHTPQVFTKIAIFGHFERKLLFQGRAAAEEKKIRRVWSGRQKADMIAAKS
jgi:hypothetical protein